MAPPENEAGEGRRRFTDSAGDFSNVLGARATAEGTQKRATNLELCGRFEGEIEVEGLV